MPALGRGKDKQPCNEYGIMICPICNKSFNYNPSSIYKLRKGNVTIHYSGYNCYRQAGGGSSK